MCDFISWIKDSSGDIYFLTDKEVNDSHMKEAVPSWRQAKSDVAGHGAIQAYYSINGTHYEDRRFWEPHRYPAAIARCIKDFEQYFSFMFRDCVTEDRVAQALLDAPKPWKKRLLSILKLASKSRLEDIQHALEDACLTPAQWESLKPLFSNDVSSADAAFDKLLELEGDDSAQVDLVEAWVKKFTVKQRVELLRDNGISLDCFDTLLRHISAKDIHVNDVAQLVEDLCGNEDEQRALLIKFGSKLSQDDIENVWPSVNLNSAAGDLLLSRASKDTLISIIKNM